MAFKSVNEESVLSSKNFNSSKNVHYEVTNSIKTENYASPSKKENSLHERSLEYSSSVALLC